MNDIAALPRIGGHLALDFANTAGLHASAVRREHLNRYHDVLDWAAAAGVLAPRLNRTLATSAERRPRDAASALAKVVALRENIYRVFARLAQRKPPLREDLVRLHQARIATLAAAEPEWAEHRVALRWPDDPADLLRPIYPVLLATGELLESGDFDRLRQCGNHPCGWLFLDLSKNGSRRWCSSAECGNATRVRRFRARTAGSV